MNALSESLRRATILSFDDFRMSRARAAVRAANQAQLIELFRATDLPGGTIIPTEVTGACQVLPGWALGVLLATSGTEDDDRATEVLYRACGRCLEPTGMAALVYGHACQGEPTHFPRWARSVLGATL